MKRIKKIVLLVTCFCFFSSLAVQAQQPRMMNGAELKIALKKLLTLGSVLYIAAHPDDENTAVLAYMSGERSMQTGYLSITRGGGGQNLIGSEKGPLMSVLRTYELLEARKIDGAEQFFTRAVDFGFSKTAEESLDIWGKKNILADVVSVIAKFKPDVLLTRFSTVKGGSGHGHHTASAILAVEGFYASGGQGGSFRENRPPGPPAKAFDKVDREFSGVKRVFWNDWRPYWRPKEITAEERERLISVDVGTYNRLLGKSYTEIAASSRSMHKSQGFGAVPRRGQWLDYFSLLAGEPAKKDPFDGIDTTWNRVPGAEKVQKLLEKANGSFLPDQPHKIIPLLLDALTQLEALPESYWTVRKSKELHAVIRSCAGLWIEATAANDEVTPGQEVKVTASVINRSGFPLTIKKLVIPGENKVVELRQALRENKPFKKEVSMKIVEKEFTHPFWLKGEPKKGIYTSANDKFTGLAAAPYPFNMRVILEAGGREISFESPVLYRRRDPVEGEKLRWLVVTPPVTVNFTGEVFYFPSDGPRKLGMILRSGPAAVSGTLKLNLPVGWQAEPASVSFKIGEPLTEKEIFVMVKPPRENAACDLTAGLLVGDQTYHFSRVTIDYPHLPRLILHPRANVRLVRVDVKRKSKRIGYIMGSGDDIPKYLAQVGYRVDILSDEDLYNQDLGIYSTVITGIRAYNTRDILKHVQKRLLDYVSNGGRLVVQYNVSRGLKTERLGPYPFRLSRNRVTVEEAAVALVKPQHPLLLHPNKITAEDFNGWVQERGLYFAGQWDPQYTPLMACCDEGEEPQKGGLLFARYGKGTFIYTGYSFFRQLPAGVPGALKLFVNIIDGGTTEDTKDAKKRR